MFDVFGSVKGLLKLDSVCIDNNIFRLHYKFTVIVLVAFSLVVTSRQYIGDPIDCIVDEIPLGVMDTYCWIYSTFTVPNSVEERFKMEDDQISTGVRPMAHGVEPKYHKYYQWVCFALFFQAMFFYIPRYLWKTWEAGRMKMLTLDLNAPIISDEQKNDRLNLLIHYFKTNLNAQNFYYYRFVFCEVLNLANVIFQAWYIDYFLDGEFSRYGLDVLNFSEMDDDSRNDPMALVFPKITKCTFKKYGSSGTLQNFDGLCVLPLNIVNEKIYVFLWFWIVFLFCVSALGMLYRLMVTFWRTTRYHLLRSKCRLARSDDINVINSRFELGDWFILYQLGKNIDPLAYKDLIRRLAEELHNTKA